CRVPRRAARPRSAVENDRRLAGAIPRRFPIDCRGFVDRKDASFMRFSVRMGAGSCAHGATMHSGTLRTCSPRTDRGTGRRGASHPQAFDLMTIIPAFSSKRTRRDFLQMEPSALRTRAPGGDGPALDIDRWIRVAVGGVVTSTCPTFTLSPVQIRW